LQAENGLHPVQYEAIIGDNNYITNGFQVVRITDITASPEQFGIVGVYPNPFNSSTSLTYNLPEAALVEVALYDLAGRQVADIVSGSAQAGQHTFTVDGAGLSSGVYVVQLQANEKVSKRKLTLIK
ncbi:MAG: T9SS type A sorting domain-containing protein, partial [Calditrichaeota bacterium]|nr:T9SS type A sorting domain-containing protein [Calditrichota bacterium]